jgi:uncharacterized integral membrane protein
MASMPTTEGPATGTTTKRRGVTISPKLVGAAVIVVAAVWFILANTAKAHIRLWVPTVTAPMWLVLLVTFVGGLVTGMLLTQRRSKKQQQQQ